MTNTTTTTTSITTRTTSTAGNSGNSNNSSRNTEPPHEPLPPRVYYARMPMPTVTNTNIEAWFTSMDYWFDASGIFSERQRSSTILAAIDPNVLSQLNDTVRAAPEIGKYEFIKQKLIEHYADSEQRKLNRLLSEMPLGDKRPSELYHEMKRVAGNVLGEVALKSLWSQRLPEAARPVIAASTGSASEFTKIADSIVDALVPRAVQQVTSAPLDKMGELFTMINALREEFRKTPNRSRSHSRNRQSSGSNHRSRSTSNNRRDSSNDDASSDECWYHRKFGNNAQHCRTPCRHQQGAASANATPTNSN